MTDRTDATETEERRAEVDQPEIREIDEIQEQQRLDEAAERLGEVENLRPEIWAGLDPLERKWTLDHAGREIQEVYHCPRPCLMEGENMAPNAYGFYRDDDGCMRINERLLESDDPRKALETYLHEFRHGYQHWEVDRFESVLRPDNLDNAIRWRQGFDGYKRPPEEVLQNTDPEAYDRQFEEYRGQPVEADAQAFADAILDRLHRPAPVL